MLPVSVELWGPLKNSQREAIEEFFDRNVDESLERCHKYTKEEILPQLLPSDVIQHAELRPNEFQGAFSYTCTITLEAKQVFVVQFREKEQDLTPIQHACELHAPLTPEVRYWGAFRSLHVYSSAFMQGKPCIYMLIEADMDASTQLRFKQTVLDLARFLTGGARQNNRSTVDFAVSKIEQKLQGHKFKNRKLSGQIRRCIKAITDEESFRYPLPQVFSHQDIHPHNFLVDMESGKISAVLDWDSAKDDLVGRNFRFVDHFLGVMTPGGWCSNRDQELDVIFYHAAIRHLQAQGFQDVTRARLVVQKIIGALEYHLFRDAEIDERTERYLDWYSSSNV